MLAWLGRHAYTLHFSAYGRLQQRRRKRTIWPAPNGICPSFNFDFRRCTGQFEARCIFSVVCRLSWIHIRRLSGAHRIMCGVALRTPKTNTNSKSCKQIDRDNNPIREKKKKTLAHVQMQMILKHIFISGTFSLCAAYNCMFVCVCACAFNCIRPI